MVSPPTASKTTITLLIPYLREEKSFLNSPSLLCHLYPSNTPNCVTSRPPSPRDQSYPVRGRGNSRKTSMREPGCPDAPCCFIVPPPSETGGEIMLDRFRV